MYSNKAFQANMDNIFCAWIQQFAISKNSFAKNMATAFIWECNALLLTHVHNLFCTDVTGAFSRNTISTLFWKNKSTYRFQTNSSCSVLGYKPLRFFQEHFYEPRLRNLGDDSFAGVVWHSLGILSTLRIIIITFRVLEIPLTKKRDLENNAHRGKWPKAWYKSA